MDRQKAVGVMSGMGSSLQTGNATVVAAFRAALVHQGIVIAVIFALLAIAWISAREWLPSGAGAAPGAAGPGTGASALAEPTARQVLRIGFGLLWIFDGVLQLQPAMPLGLPSQVITPASASSPGWVRHLVGWAANVWTYHPVTAAASAVWIQVGIGIWLLVAAGGVWSRLGGLASVGWGLVVWVFGEAFGGVFGHGLTWLFGAPGAVIFYCVAGGLIALPLRAWASPLLGRLLLTGLGLFFVGMAVLQAWPGRGFWQGRVQGRPGSLAAMIRAMAQAPQPRLLSALVANWATFVEAHGFAVNLVAVITLAAIGGALLSARPRLLGPAVAAVAAACLADWVLIEDFGFFGGVGTDPNSMIPLMLVVIGGYLAVTRVPVAVAAAATPPAGDAEPAEEPAGAAPPPGAEQPAGAPPAAGPRTPGGWWERMRPAAVRRSIRTASLGSIAAVGALAMIAVGGIPMAGASANPNADPIIAEAIAGSSATLDFAAPAFQLTDQHGRQVSLAGLRGKAVLLTFLDPVCTTDCPLIAQEFREAGQLLGANAPKVELVAVVANPIYRALTFTNAFDRQERLDTVPNWLYLTGTLPQLTRVWRDYGIAVVTEHAGAMVAHNDVAFVIDGTGHMRQELSSDPGPGTASSKSSFAVVLAGAAERVLGSS
jgi:cytochrome oxidase Cu insertion factor (SCO1/SenC/PrrC family)